MSANLPVKTLRADRLRVRVRARGRVRLWTGWKPVLQWLRSVERRGKGIWTLSRFWWLAESGQALGHLHYGDEILIYFAASRKSGKLCSHKSG
jgi:hypothetical protein